MIGYLLFGFILSLVIVFVMNKLDVEDSNDPELLGLVVVATTFLLPLAVCVLIVMGTVKLARRKK